MKLQKNKYGKSFLGGCYKRSYPSKKDAKVAMKSSRKVGKKRMKSFYLCKACEKFHLSHLTTKEFLRKQADYKLMDFLKGNLAGESHGR
jgi:hypothetical protein